MRRAVQQEIRVKLTSVVYRFGGLAHFNYTINQSQIMSDVVTVFPSISFNVERGYLRYIAAFLVR